MSSLPRYRAFLSTPNPGHGHHGDTAIFVRSGVPCVSLGLHSTLQAVAIKVFLNRFYTVCSLYLPPGAPVDRSDLCDLVHELPFPPVRALKWSPSVMG